MPPDPVRVDEVKAWLAKATEDLRSAEHALTADPPILSDALFHSQQASEKAFKAFLVWHEHVFRKTHNLEELGEKCQRLDASLKGVVDRAVPLTEYAWAFRYPGEAVVPDEAEAQSALAVAREVFQAVLDRLPQSFRSQK